MQAFSTSLVTPRVRQNRKLTYRLSALMFFTAVSALMAQELPIVSGTVTDAETGEPVKRFVVIAGSRTYLDWFDYSEEASFENGQYEYTLREIPIELRD